MKIFVYTLFALFIYNSNAQPYLPMLEEDNAWSVDVHFCPFGDPDTFTVTSQITITGEEVVNGITYKVISTSNSNGGCLVREENGFVYKYNEDINDEEVMYDFNLEVGESFSLLESPSCTLGDSTPGVGVPLQVTATSIQFIAGESRKVIEFSNAHWGEEYWIEGIGSITGFEPYVEVLDITCWSRLACFTKDGVITYFNGATACDNTTLDVSEFSSEEIVLYPNPVTNRSILHLPSRADVDRIKILDIHGRILRDEQISKDYYTIDVMDYKSGLYFYQAFSENKLLKSDSYILK